MGGVDTHKALHVAAVVDSHDRVLGSECFPNTRHGYKQNDNALPETINGLYKVELIYRPSWRSREAVEMATLKWVHWYNHQRRLRQTSTSNKQVRPWRPDLNKTASTKPGGIHDCPRNRPARSDNCCRISGCLPDLRKVSWADAYDLSIPGIFCLPPFRN